MAENKTSAEHARYVIKWASTHHGYWRKICTPNDEFTPEGMEMTPDLMKILIKRFHKKSMDELIIVMLTVHRNEPFVSDLLSKMSNRMLCQLWNNESESIIERIINYL